MELQNDGNRLLRAGVLLSGTCLPRRVRPGATSPIHSVRPRGVYAITSTISVAEVTS
jgi:hypothetical protein